MYWKISALLSRTDLILPKARANDRHVRNGLRNRHDHRNRSSRAVTLPNAQKTISTQQKPHNTSLPFLFCSLFSNVIKQLEKVLQYLSDISTNHQAFIFLLYSVRPEPQQTLLFNSSSSLKASAFI
jgi:hypothetical protein